MEDRVIIATKSSHVQDPSSKQSPDSPASRSLSFISSITEPVTVRRILEEQCNTKTLKNENKELMKSVREREHTVDSADGDKEPPRRDLKEEQPQALVLSRTRLTKLQIQCLDGIDSLE